MRKSDIFLALAEPGQELRFYQGQEGGPLRFHFVDFRQEHKIRISLAEIAEPKRWPIYEKEAVNMAEKADYLQSIAHLISEIKAQAWGKVVWSRAEEFQVQKPLSQVLKNLHQAYPQATVYALSHPVAGTWIGASPELLLKKNGDALSTVSLAGTVKFNDPLGFQAKEMQEQSMVTDFIAQQFEDHPQVQDLRIGERFEKEAGKIKHLCTPIEASAREGFQPLELIAKLHPTPAVAGLPRQAALDYLAQNEKYERTFYSGFFGWEEAEQAKFWVNLRCGRFLDAQKIQLFAGGGITADSNPQKEWEETEAKMRTLADALV